MCSGRAYDNTFSGDGRLALFDVVSSGVFESAELARDGDIVVGAKGIAYEENHLTPLRLNGNGTVERFYDGVMVNEGYEINVNDTRVSFDGQKVVFFAERTWDVAETRGGIVRYERDGTIDETFGGGDGVVQGDLGAFGDFQSDHKIVAGDDLDLADFGQTSAQVRVERRIYETVPQTTVSVRAAADNHVRDGSFAATNFGSSTTMEVKRVNAPGYSRETYLRFDVTGVGSPTQIVSAKVRLFGRMLNTAAPSVQVGLYPVGETDATWSEASLTWNNRPSSFVTPLLTATISGTTGRYYEFDVTSFLRDQKANGATVLAFAVKATGVGEGWAGFTSDEASANRPELSVAQT